MSQLPEEKLHKAMSSNLGDYRFNEVALAHRLDSEPYVIHEKLWNFIIAYIYSNARKYEAGLVPLDKYEIIRVCKKIKDYALADEINLDVYSTYGSLPPKEYIAP